MNAFYQIPLDEELPNLIRFFPNPVTNTNLVIQGLEKQGIYEFTFTDINGKRVSQGKLDTSELTNINLGSMKSGIYFITLRNENAIQIGRIIVENE